MSNWTFTVPEQADVTWTGADGNPKTANVAAQSTHGFDDPCEAFSFARSYMQETGAKYSAQSRGALLSSLSAACQGRPTPSTVTQTTDSPDSGGANVPDEPGDETEGDPPSQNPPQNPTTPEAVDAPPPDPSVLAEDRDPTPPSHSDPTTPAEERAHDPQTPSPETVMPTDQDPGGGGQEATDRVQRNDPTPGLPHYEFGLNDTDDSRPVADPVDLFSGTFGLIEVDFEFPGRRFPLTLKRRYRSGVPYFGPWGFNWDHNHNSYARPLDDGYVAIWTGLINEDVFTPQADGSFLPPLGKTKILSHQPASVFNPESYELRAPDGTTWHFARPDGWPHMDRLPLLRVQDRFGNGHDYHYDAEGRLSRVADELGNHLQFTYGNCGFLEVVSDQTGRKVQYWHDEARAHLIGVIRPATPEAPNGATVSFEYDSHMQHGRLRHNLTRIIDELGQTKLLNVYCNDPTAAGFGRVVTQFAGDHRTDFQYTRLATPSRLPAAINLPAWWAETIVDGTYKLSTFNFRGDLLEERFRLVRDGSYRLFVMANRYDKRGNLSLSAMPNGLIRHFLYDVDNPDPAAWGNLLEVNMEAPPSRPTLGRRVVRLRYEDRFQQLVTLEDESGALTRYHYDHQTVPGANGALVRIEHPDATLPDGAVQSSETRLSVNAFGQVVDYTTPEDRLTRYHYNAQGLVEAIERDPDGLALRIAFTYDPHGNAVQTRDGVGNGISFEFDQRNRLIRASKPEIDGVAPEIRLLYHPTGQLAEHIRPAGAAQGAVGNEISTRFTYDVLGRQCEKVEAADTVQERRVTFAYDAWGRIVRMTDALGRQNIHCYDERGRMFALNRKATNGTTREIRWIHDLNGMTSKVIYPDASTEEYLYDAWDRPLRLTGMMTDEGQVETRFTYGPDDQLTLIESHGPDGHGDPAALLLRHQFTYDARGRLVGQGAGVGEIVTWYDADGLRKRTVDPAGHETRLAYDAAARLVRVTDPLGNRTLLTLDAADRLLTLRIEEPGPGGAVTMREEHRAYNARNEQISHHDFLGRETRYIYDDAGRLMRTASPGGVVEEHMFDLHGEITGVSSQLDGMSVTTHLTRDPMGRITGFTDATGAQTRFEYDDFDALLRRIHPDGATEQMIYATNGRLDSRVLPSGTRFDYTHRADGATAAIAITPSAGLAAMDDLDFRRDGMGKLTQAAQGGNVLTRRYDQAGRMTQDILNANVLSLRHDDAQSRAVFQYSDGREDLQKFDALGRLATVALQTAGATGCTGTLPIGPIASYDYSGTSRLVRRTVASGIASQFGYDDGLRLTDLQHLDTGGVNFAQIAYGYGANGSRDSVAVTGNPWGNTALTTDEQNRLRQAVSGAVTDQFSVDAADGRTKWVRDDNGALTTHDTPSNARHQIISHTVTSAGGVTAQPYTYSADGVLTFDFRHRYVPDGFGLIREIRRLSDDALLLTLDWDPLGRLQRVTRPGGQVVDLQHFDAKLTEYVAQPSGMLTQLTQGMMPGEYILSADGAPHFPLADARGSLMLTTSLAGLPEERRVHELFGKTMRFDAAGAAPVAEAEAFVPGAFGGMHYLPDVGLYVAGSRLYDPDTGRFLQSDPMGLLDSANSYVYCRHNPVDFMDSSGAWIESAWDVASLGIGVASLTYNLTRDDVDWWAVGLDIFGILADTVALILPGVPGGAGAAIKAVRTARAGGEVVEQITRVGRAVRYTQSAHGVTMAGRGVYMSYEQAQEGNYGTAAFGVALSAVGIRGSLGRFQTAWRSGRVPASLYSVQGNAADILRSGKIWGMTEGRVWSGTQLGAGAARTGLSAADLPPMGDRLVLEFTEGAQDVFQHHTVWGIFTGWKGLYGNQHVTEIGDIALRNVDEVADFSLSINKSGLGGYFARVTSAAHIPPSAAHQAEWMSRARAAFPVAFDMALNTTPAIFAGIMGLGNADPNGAGGSDRTGNSQPQIVGSEVIQHGGGGPK